MKILAKYIIKKFWIYFISTTIVIAIFVFVINLFETANIFSKRGMEFSLTLKTSFLQTPYYLYLVIPLITLISSIIVFNEITVHNEYKAIYASGYRKTIILIPLIISSFIIITLSFFYGDFLATPLYKNSRKNTKKMEFANSFAKINDIYFVTNKIINKNILKDIYIEDIKNKIIMKSASLKWDKESGLWIAENGMLINYSNTITISSFSKTHINFLPEPDNILIEKISDENSYGITDIIKRINKLKMLSLNYTGELVSIHFKISVILLNFLSVIIAFLIAQTKIIKNKSISISFAVIISLFLWFSLIISKRIGEIEIISPFMVVLIPYTIFLSISCYIIWRKKLL
ncbi:MAG: LptF/LptG family permease [Elusimicrobiota bacterium]